jgi:hypothetical protein
MQREAVRAGGPEGFLQRGCQPAEGFPSRPEGIEHDPAAWFSPRQPGHQSRPQQRRLAATGGPQDEQQPRGAGRERFHLGLRLSQRLILAKKHRRVFALETAQARKG